MIVTTLLLSIATIETVPTTVRATFRTAEENVSTVATRHPSVAARNKAMEQALNSTKIDGSNLAAKVGNALHGLSFRSVGPESKKVVVYYRDGAGTRSYDLCTVRNVGEPHQVWYSAFRWCAGQLGVDMPLTPPTPEAPDDRGLYQSHR